jgi:hypothetical protein
MKSLFWLASACLLVVICQSNLNAQIIEMSTDIVQDEEGEGAGMRIMSFSTSGDFDMSNGSALMMASPMGNGGFSFGGPDQFGLLGDSGFQSELNLVDEQIERFKEVQENFNERMTEVTKQMRSDDGKLNLDADVIERIRALSEEIKAQKKEEIEGLLLPEQLERLKQVTLQKKMSQQGAMSALRGKEVAEALGLDEEQLSSLREKSKELSARVQEEIAAAKEKARKELLDELTPDQQEKLKTMIGEKFEEPERTPSERFQPRRVRQQSKK